MKKLIIRHNRLTFDEHNKKYPTLFLEETSKASAYLSVIPYSQTDSTLVYFVTGKEGTEYGQYATAQEAIERLRSL